MDQIQRAAGHCQYAFIDLKDIQIHPEDCEKTAFLTSEGPYEWIAMPFGLTNAPATFQALIDELLELLRKYVAGLRDEMAVWADSPLAVEPPQSATRTPRVRPQAPIIKRSMIKEG